MQVAAEGPLAGVELVRGPEVVDRVELDGRLDVTLQRTLSGLRAGEWIYVRVEQRDGGMAWSSPIFIE